MTPLESQLRASLSAARGPDAVVLSREQLPSDEALEVVHAQLEMLVYRPEPVALTDAQLDYFFSKPEEP